MIKKIILGLICAGAAFLVYTTFVNGLSLSGRLPLKVEIMSYREMIDQGNILNARLKEIEELNTTKLPAAERNVELESTGFDTKMTEYKTLEATASKDEIAEANKKQEYLLDYLWIIIGNYANDNNVKFKMQTDDVNLRINFDITGSYVSIINFIYDLENDENLRFNLNGITLASSTSEDTTKANFSVDGVTVKTSNSTKEM